MMYCVLYMIYCIIYRFSTYITLDTYDSCLIVISVSDLYYHCQDMGEEYTAAELTLIAQQIDPDGVDCADFSSFIGWWCSEDEIDE